MPADEDDGRERCTWATGPWLVPYHDEEWGVPVHDDRTHFEFLVLEGAQAGLSWLTILKRRHDYRRVFADFDPAKVARITPARLESILADASIIRNRRKVESVVGNAKAFLTVQEEYGSFDDYLWDFVDGQPIVNGWRSTDKIPATTPLSDAVSADLRSRGFRFIGPTVCYAHLQATGLVNDHLTGCFRYGELVAPDAGTKKRKKK
ncbi:MAG TPA: DNA-3-methyladenine glycosylase I [Acidimicrobiales bacterium]|jgi:DNA-3-methyladenine glycosylase I